MQYSLEEGKCEKQILQVSDIPVRVIGEQVISN